MRSQIVHACTEHTDPSKDDRKHFQDSGEKDQVHIMFFSPTIAANSDNYILDKDIMHVCMSSG